MYATGYANDIIVEILDGPFKGERFECTHGNFRNYFNKLGYKEYDV